MLKPQNILALVGLCLGLALPCTAQDNEFTRFTAGEQEQTGALQIAVARYRSKTTKAEVVLYGVVHIADGKYYQAVQKDLDSYDCVLWEGVKPGKDTKPDESMKGIGSLQGVMGEVLGLTFQKDGIDYKRDHFVHADMDMDQLKKASGGDMSKVMPGAGMFNSDMMKNLGPMLKMGSGFIKNLFKSNPAMQNRIKHMFAQQLSNAGESMAQMGADMQRVIVVERNKVVMVKLKEQLAKRKDGSIAIFYGAAHMGDFDERLAKLGFEQVEKRWMNAWVIGEGSSATPPAGRQRSKPRGEEKKKAPAKRWF